MSDVKVFGQTVHEIPPMDRSEWEHLIRFGFATGGYVFRCGDCRGCFNGVDKRASRCYECAKALFDGHQAELAMEAERLEQFDLFTATEEACRACGNTKADQGDILLSMVEEVGELTVEIKIDKGLKDKPHSSDGVVGEAIDVILTALDIIHSELGELNRDTLNPIFQNKMAKWVRKYSERNG